MSLFKTREVSVSALVQQLIQACQLEPGLLAQDQSSLQLAVKHYRQVLVQTPRAMATLKAQGIKQSAIDYFQLGFADRSLGKSLGDSRRTNSAIVRGALERAELLKANGHPAFRGYVVFPIVCQGNVYGAYGLPAASYLKTSITTERVSTLHLFHQDGLLKDDWVLLCLSPLDAVIVWQLGWHNVVSLIRTKALSEQQLILLKAHKNQLIIVSTKHVRDSLFVSKLKQQLEVNDVDFTIIWLPNKRLLSQLLIQEGEAHTKKQLNLLLGSMTQRPFITATMNKDHRHE